MKITDKILYLHSTKIVKEDILWGLLEKEYTVECPMGVLVDLSSYGEEDILNLCNRVQGYSLVVTQNFSVTVAEACHRCNCPYVSWVYDSPQKELYRKEAFYDTNYIFVFDRCQLKRLLEIGISNVFYQPLAANIAQTSALQILDEDILRYGADVSFVGRLYHRNYYSKFMEHAPKDVSEKLSHVVRELSCHWGKENSIFGTLPEDVSSYVDEFMYKENLSDYKIGRKYLIEVLMLAPSVANEERTRVLRLLAEKYHTRLYTTEPEKCTGLGKTEVCPEVNYQDEMYKVFFSSKINLNLTMRSIETGIPQRVFDIMAVGGFVMSNYQEEMEELFVPDKEIVFFRDLDELQRKAEYYLTHERERLSVAIAGYQKVCKKYNYGDSLEKMLEKVQILEEERCKKGE